METLFTFGSKGAMTWISHKPSANIQYKSLVTVVARHYTTLYPMRPSTAAAPSSYIARRLSSEAFASNICNQGYFACQGLAAQQENYAGAARQSSRLFPCQPTTTAGHRSTLTASSVWFTGSLRPHFIYSRQHPYFLHLPIKFSATNGRDCLPGSNSDKMRECGEFSAAPHINLPDVRS